MTGKMKTAGKKTPVIYTAHQDYDIFRCEVCDDIFWSQEDSNVCPQCKMVNCEECGKPIDISKMRLLDDDPVICSSCRQEQMNKTIEHWNQEEKQMNENLEKIAEVADRLVSFRCAAEDTLRSSERNTS